MSVIPGDLRTERGPPLAVPLAHFLAGLSALLGAAALGLTATLGLAPGLSGLAHVHLLLVGWVCLTIMGAMTQFVPVWSGVPLHSRRLAVVQLLLAGTGLAGMVGAFLWGRLGPIPVAGTLLVAGVWVFVYNLARTLPVGRGPDVTERHFGLALVFFVLATLLGLALASSYTVPILAALPVGRTGVVGAHATLAVFGAVLTTVLGALYQLGTMFTQTELTATERRLQRGETTAYPVGVLALAAGRLFEVSVLARVGGLLVVAGLVTVAAILGRKLVATHVELTPMLSRYGVFVAGVVLWAALTVPVWLSEPTAPTARFGAPGSLPLLAGGVVGFVVAGTLYHVVPFIVWVDHYSDLLGYEPVPMVDDLYDDRLARVDFGCLLVGVAGLCAGSLLEGGPTLAVGSAALVAVGALVFATNLVGVVRQHSPHGVLGTLALRAEETNDSTE
jgi:hypothetical protein